MKNFIPKAQLPNLLLLHFLENPNSKKISSEQFHLCEAKISLEEFTKSIKFQINNKFPDNDSLTVEFYKHFSNKLSPILLDVFDAWDKLDTMRGREAALKSYISVTYKKGAKKDIAN